MAPDEGRGYLRDMAQKVLAWIILVAVVLTVLVGGWMIAQATHHMILFWIAIGANVAFMAYAAWSNRKRNA